MTAATLKSNTSLQKRLHAIMTEMERSAKTAQMVSMNASIVAVQARNNTNDAYAFEAVAEQILSISRESIDRISTLRAIVDQTQQLTATINKAGRQRMISQRFMKLALLDALRSDPSNQEAQSAERNALQQTFESVLAELLASPLNNESITLKLESVRLSWNAFLDEMESGNIAAAASLNEEVLQRMNDAVNAYEDLAGH
ncbi:type IV pili methyl-accepting chemotaxis transducer N-terminal domain-containing protein [Pelagicoccus sp. SDUM812003]|uniref:type IV pili methyl-accepting chemotaxis transducer N-terminal domain-containing protein n=1 Tax=Pelagicoccus sp. SDUM812003 TaxID=3041267 RepID=UPI00280F1CC4|nr:type IV pili methyl-accepting chemotaxis transducer N-terminal domain-containing protein [Pelagicoccus sp. SDUM812003]MDQ8205686.1 type IV pili methyl-accepting chemotaxis transducer N-terminal domain-containing protein [Pelagicoccus sp. SDUM812003]